MLTCENLSLHNEFVYVFSGLSFTTLPCSVTVLRGENGSGKTSLLKMMAGLIDHNPGKILWNGIHINHDIKSFHKNLCYIGHKNALKQDLTVIENLQFWARFKGEIELLPIAIRYFDLEKYKDVEVGYLSHGMQRRVELAKILLSNTHLWLLDEPDANLDRRATELLTTLVKAKAEQGGVVIIASHSRHAWKFANNDVYIPEFKETI